MQKAPIVFVIIATAFLIAVLLQDPYISVVPGWHTTSFSPHTINGAFLCFWLFVLSGAYWVLTRRTIKINKAIFSIHLLLTIPLLLFHLLITGVTEFVLLMILYDPFAFAYNLAIALFVGSQIIFVSYFLISLRTANPKV